MLTFCTLVAVGGPYDRNATPGQTFCYVLILVFVCAVAFFTSRKKKK
jgi:hypothetical protein